VDRKEGKMIREAKIKGRESYGRWQGVIG